MTQEPDSGGLRLGWFSTGRGEGSRGLLEATLGAIDSRRLRAGIEFVFCNRDRDQHQGTDRFLDIADSHGIPVVTLSSQGFRHARGGRRWSELREEFDRAVMGQIAGFSPDLVVTAGYMLIAPVLCRHYRMVNLHPALPGGPAGMWQEVIWRQIEGRARESGVMVNLVTEEVDGGPVVSYCRYPIAGPEFDPLWTEAASRPIGQLKDDEGEALPLFRAIRAAGLARERPFLVSTLAAIADQRVDLTRLGRGEPVDLTTEVESALASAW